MTKDKASKVAQALNSVNDFEVFMDEIIGVYNSVEGDFDDFYNNQLLPLLQAEMRRREAELEAL